MRARRMSDNACTTRVGSRRSVISAASLSAIPMRRSANANNITPPFGTDAPTIEGGGYLLAFNRWQRERQQAIVDHGGCGSVRLGTRLALTPKFLRQFSRLRYIRQRPAVNKGG